MDINLSLSPAPGITTNWLVVAIYKASAPSTLVSSQGFAAPHTSAQNVVFTGLDDAVYNVITYENTSNAAGGTIRHQFIYDPTYQSASVRDDLPLTTDSGTGNPVSGTNTFTRADLLGWTYSIERRGFGTMVKGVDVSVSTDGTIITLLTAGDKFQTNEVFILHFLPQIIISKALNNANAGFLFTDYVLVTANTTIDNTYFGKIVQLQGSGPTLAITIPDFASFPDMKFIAFESDGGSHINATIQTGVAGQFIWHKGVNKTKIYLGQAEHVWMYKANGKLHISHRDGNFLTVGEVVHQFKKQDNSNPLTTGELNTVFADGTTLSRAVYPRLWEWVQTLDASDLVTDSVWLTADVNGKFTNKGKFSTGDGSTTFRVPILYTTYDGNGNAITGSFLRGVDGSARKAGSFEADGLAAHKHDTEAGAIGDFGYGPSKSRHGLYDGAGSGQTDLTDGGQTMASVALGTETKPVNIGIYMLIRV
jgi:hypothetical protein